ncbi:hypothetical protein NHQ30_007965 [Ciborinia camelliae]|nr:hypothetical protein NHQ30_007965 [Ciborinia camelliae]
MLGPLIVYPGSDDRDGSFAAVSFSDDRFVGPIDWNIRDRRKKSFGVLLYNSVEVTGRAFSALKKMEKTLITIGNANAYGNGNVNGNGDAKKMR